MGVGGGEEGGREGGNTASRVWRREEEERAVKGQGESRPWGLWETFLTSSPS